MRKPQYHTNFDAELPTVQPKIINDLTAQEPVPEPEWKQRLKMAGLCLAIGVCFGLAIWCFSWGVK